jgi:hypothetical protein
LLFVAFRLKGRVVAAAGRENIGVNRRQALPVDTNQAGVYSRNSTIAEVRDRFSTLRLIGGEHVIEGSILSDDHDDMLDGRGCSGMLGDFLSGGCDRHSQVDKQSKQARANHKVLPGLRRQAG